MLSKNGSCNCRRLSWFLSFVTTGHSSSKYAKKDDPESSNLWVEHRCEYQSPIEEELYEEEYKRCPEGANIWRDVLKLEKIVQEDAEERALVQELNRQYQEQLAAEEAKKTKKKPPAEAPPADAVTDAAQASAPQPVTA